MAGFAIDARGVQAALRALKGKIRPRVIRAMREAMGPMHSRVVAEAPRDTGELARDVKMVVKGEEKGRMSVLVVVARKEAIYGPVVEFGAKKRGREPDDFMLRAFDHESGHAARVVQDRIVEGIGREAERLR